jgi:hypothetical protein
MDFIIDYEAIMDDFSPAHGTVDLSTQNGQLLILVGFGNGIFEEVRVVGRTSEAVFHFVRLIQGGGYDQDVSGLASDKKLYQVGDACFPAIKPFIFIAPSTTAGEAIDFSKLETEIQHRAAELEKEQEISISSVGEIPAESISFLNPAKPQKQWWKFW